MAVEAFFGKDCRITMERDGAAETDQIHGEITSYSESGGAKSVESIPVFGGGKVIREMLTEDTEVSFDVLPTDLKWFEPLYGAKTTETVEVVKSTETGRDDYRITLAWAEGFDASSPPEPDTGEATRYTFVNANATTVEPTEDADGELKATITFKLSATDQDGNAQIYREYTSDASSTPFPSPYGKGGVRQAYGSYT